MSALNRSKIFCDVLGLHTTMLTVAFNNASTKFTQLAKLNKRCSDRLEIVSLYDDMLDSNSYEPKNVLKDNQTQFTTVDVENVKTDYRMYDEVGTLIGYARRHPDMTLSYINYINNGKVVRRETFDSRGFICRSETMQPTSNEDEALTDIFHRPCGNPSIIKIGTLKKNVGIISSIQLIDANNQYITTLSNDSQLNEYWIKSIAKRAKEPILFIVDRCNELFLPALSAKLAYPEKVKLIACIHGIHTGGGDMFAAPTNNWYKSAIENMDKVDALVVLTEHQKNDMLARYAHADKKVHVIPHSCNENPINDFANRNRNKIVYVARFSPEKKHVQAVEIFADIRKSCGTAELHLYGFGQTENDIRAKITELNLAESVFIHSYNQDISKIYSEAGLSILTSDTEGFCMSVLESVSYGCPVVSFNIKYGPEAIIENEVNGLLVHPFDKNEFANKIIDLLNDPLRHERLVQGCKSIFNKYGVDAVAKKWKALLDSI